ncbi:MAG: hypothetical protein WCC28_24015 [Mycobacterium sp.]|uniref:hypothetical protein n=1 Tax=Mycobacterium sp. TaxID=1785 RepID=UPI003C75B9A9
MTIPIETGDRMTDGTIPHNHVAIIGTGFGGIAAAIRLQQDGFHEHLTQRAPSPIPVVS